MQTSDIPRPNSNSTLLDSGERSGRPKNISTSIRATPRTPNSAYIDLPSFVTSDLSHIPRSPPTQKTYTIPSLLNDDHNQFYGMIALKEDDVCYTSGTIEWVGKKRNFPLNSGFKLLRDKRKHSDEEPLHKKGRVTNINQFSSVGVSNIKECDCADILPTVNAIVDHLNALHEAVDIVDLRLNTLEDVVHENDQ